jgi:ribosomal protein S5
VTGNNLRVVIGDPQGTIGARNHATDAAAGAGIDEGIHPVEKDIAQVQHVGLRTVDVDIRIRVGRRNVPQLEVLAIGLLLVL